MTQPEAPELPATDPDDVTLATSTPEPSTKAQAEAPGHGLMYGLLALFVLAMAFGGWGLFRVFAPVAGDPGRPLQDQQVQFDDLQQQIATLTRSDQISREANRDLQGTLAERDEEIAGLRADVAFYERFVGATAPRRGLRVHELQLQAQGDQAWHFTATLTQNLNRGAVNRGRLSLSVEGTNAGKLQRLGWTGLRQQPKAEGLEYSFKYFQAVEGDLMLPPGMKPLRVSVRLQPAGGATVEQSFAWTDALQPAATTASATTPASTQPGAVP